MKILYFDELKCMISDSSWSTVNLWGFKIFEGTQGYSTAPTQNIEEAQPLHPLVSLCLVSVKIEALNVHEPHEVGSSTGHTQGPRWHPGKTPGGGPGSEASET